VPLDQLRYALARKRKELEAMLAQAKGSVYR
jgi:hypothetical protein